jgi:hypothetical protein
MLLVDCGGVIGRNLARRNGCGRNFGQPEIQHLGVSAFGHENVCRFDVAVDDTKSMSGIECVGDVDGDWEESLHFHRPPGNTMLERHSVKKLHGDECVAVLKWCRYWGD